MPASVPFVLVGGNRNWKKREVDAPLQDTLQFFMESSDMIGHRTDEMGKQLALGWLYLGRLAYWKQTVIHIALGCALSAMMKTQLGRLELCV